MPIRRILNFIREHCEILHKRFGINDSEKKKSSVSATVKEPAVDENVTSVEEIPAAVTSS
jgi:hypothetical protein